MNNGFQIDTGANRSAVKWSTREIIGRGLWEVLSVPFFSWTPRLLWGVRCTTLRLFGARIGRRVHIHPTVRITIPWNLMIEDHVGIGDGAILYSLGSINIRSHATVSQYAHLCAGTHDFRKDDMPLLKMPIEIGVGAWICADAFVGPNVKVGSMSVVGARAVVTRDVPDNVVVAGNPARVIGQRV